MKNPIIVLTGPTASGKTAMSLDLAARYNCEIICADSMTVYRGMDIGTDKPSIANDELLISNQISINKLENSGLIRNSKLEIRNSDNAHIVDGIKHHLIDVVNPDEEFNVSIFVDMVKKLVNEIQGRGKIPMLVGGSVMYIDAFVYDYQMPEVAPNEELRKKLEEKSTEELFAQLCECDPDCEWTIDRQNKRRIIRAIEVCMATGKPFSEQKSKKSLPENVLYLAVDKEREQLYTNIDSRVDAMFRQGFVDEVRALHSKYDHNTAMQAAGYKQIIQFLDGEIDLETAIAKTKQAHRNYAKRQLTWLRKNEDVNWIQNITDAEKSISKHIT